MRQCRILSTNRQFSRAQYWLNECPVVEGIDMKTTRLLGIATLAIAASSCGVMGGGLSGSFEPACIAYAGETISLDDGRFEWDKFTDAISIGEDGEPIDPYPGFPKTGRYDRDGEKITWYADDKASLDARYLLEHRNRTYLLTWEQNEAVLNGEDMPTCALRLVE